MNDIVALGTDVASDVVDLGHLVLQPVVNTVVATAKIPLNYGNNNTTTEPTATTTTTTTTGSSNTDISSHDSSIDLFSKTASAIFVAVIVYAIADIRHLIRNHREKMVVVIPSSSSDSNSNDDDRSRNSLLQQMIDLPITDVNVMTIVSDNLSVLQQMMKKGDIDFYIAAVHRYKKELAAATAVANAEAAEAVDARNREVSQQPATTTTSTGTTGSRPLQNEISTSCDNTASLVPTVAQHQEQQDPQRELQMQPPHPVPRVRNGRRQTRRRSIFESIQPQQQLSLNTLEVFDDEHSCKELVYGIMVNRDKKQIMIVFRGSVTMKDWLVDSKVILTSVPNPLLRPKQPPPPPAPPHGTADDGTGRKKKYRESNFLIPQSRFIGIHAGFHEYLFASRSSQTDGTPCKYNQILISLQTLLENDESLHSYSINVTGHSLGGALATIFSFYLAADKDNMILPLLQLPITCISFASPKSGNIQFARAFQELELDKKILCLRVANYRDLVTERPDRLTCWTFCLQNSIFRHVGIELLLYPDRTERANKVKQGSDRNKKYRIRYPRIRRSRISQFSDDFVLSLYNTIHCTASVTCGCCINDYMRWHSCDEYLNRVEHIEDVLQSVPMQVIHDRYHAAVSEESESFSIRVRSSKPTNLPSGRL